MQVREAAAEDFGLFGPGSVAWRIHADPSLVIGGMRALLIQALNPLAMAAVAQSKTFQTDPWGQLQRTVDYVLITTFGDTPSARRAGARVRAVHKQVRGIDEITGLPYRADDPELLLWVHCAEVDSFLNAYRRYGGSLSETDANRYAAEMVSAAELVGLSASEVPATTVELSDFLDSATRVCVTPSARAGMNWLLNPQVSPPRRVLWGISFAAVLSILPRKVRELYGLPWFEPVDPFLRVSVFSLYRVLNVFFPRPELVRDALERARGSSPEVPLAKRGSTSPDP